MSLFSKQQQSLEPFFAAGWITEVVSQLQSGKEATVFLCRAAPSTDHEFLIAKIYRDYGNRSFRHDAAYLEGMFPADADLRVVVRKNNHKGRTLKFGSWLEREFVLLRRLAEAGAAVPWAVERSGDAILMELVGSAGSPAPMLKHLRPDRELARRLFDQVLRNIEIFLFHHCVHADLSEYNLLCDAEEIWIIDFPQAVDARFNSNAQGFLARDVDRVCRFFTRRGVESSPEVITAELWDRYLRGEI